MDKPKLPDGWQAWDPCRDDHNRPVACDCCNWKGCDDDVDDYIPDFEQRVDPGMTVPVGVCPATHTDPKNGDYTCGGLVYYSDVQIIYRRLPNILERIAEEI